MADIFLSTGYIAEEHSQAIQSEGGSVYKELPASKAASKSNINQKYTGIWRIDI